MESTNTDISSFLKTQSRHKLIIHKNRINGIKAVDIGFSLAKELNSLKSKNHLSLKSKKILDNILSKSIVSHDLYGSILAIENVGILFESELKINFKTLLDQNSKNNALFLKWDGETDYDKLFFLTKVNGIEINIEKLSHIRL